MRGVVVPLLDLIALKGEKAISNVLARFSCNGLNDEVETYLKETSVRHSSKNTSVTHLVMTPDCSKCLAYYTLAMKPFAISSNRLTSRQKREMHDVAKVRADTSSREFSIAAYLIAQLARNFAVPADWYVSGRDLLTCVFSQINGIRSQIGGKVAFVEYEKDKPALLKFYQANGFEEFKVPSDGDRHGRLGQLFYFLANSTESAEAAQ